MQNLLNKNWQKHLNQSFKITDFKALSKNVKQLYKSSRCLPKLNLIFNAFNTCDLSKIKVVIIGQDPYPTPGYANGLSFSVNDNVNPFPKSLNNIFKAIKSDLNIDVPENGNLERWAKQGVFLLNTVLTVEAKKANSHHKIGWQRFTDEVIKLISLNNNNVVFMLWGNQAKQKKELIDTSKHLVLETVHPSPLSAYRGFFECKHFSKTNKYLANHSIKTINW